MATAQDDESFDHEAYTSACVRTALKRYMRRRRIKKATLLIMASMAAVVPWLFNFEGSTIMVWYVGILVVLAYGETEQRLRTMQIRLARMRDLLHRIAGDSPEEQDELLMELVAEVGPVTPDPKSYSALTNRPFNRWFQSSKPSYS